MGRVGGHWRVELTRGGVACVCASASGRSTRTNQDTCPGVVATEMAWAESPVLWGIVATERIQGILPTDYSASEHRFYYSHCIEGATSRAQVRYLSTGRYLWVNVKLGEGQA